METFKKIIAAILSPIIGSIFYSIVVIVNSFFEGESFDEIPSAFMFFIGNLGALIFIAKFTLWLSPKSNWPYVFGVIVYTLLMIYSMVMLGLFPFYYYLICIVIGVGATFYHQKNMSKEKVSDEPDNEVFITDTKRNLENKYLQISNLYLKGGDIQQAKHNAEMAADLLTGNPDAYEFLGSIHHLQLKDYNRSIEYFTKAINLSPEDCNLHFQRSNVHMENNDNKNAKLDLDKAIELASIDSPLTRLYDKKAKEMMDFERVKDYYILQSIIQGSLNRD